VRMLTARRAPVQWPARPASRPPKGVDSRRPAAVAFAHSHPGEVAPTCGPLVHVPQDEAVPDSASLTGWKIEAGPFSGWEEAPEW
jgi:hypothetical protein